MHATTDLNHSRSKATFQLVLCFASSKIPVRSNEIYWMITSAHTYKIFGDIGIDQWFSLFNWISNTPRLTDEQLFWAEHNLKSPKIGGKLRVAYEKLF